MVAPSRGRIIVDTNFPYYDKPVTVDGYGVYVVFKTRQWCWAHILREAKDAGKTSRQAHALYDTLKKKFLFANPLADGGIGVTLPYDTLKKKFLFAKGLGHHHRRRRRRRTIPGSSSTTCW